MDKYEMAKEALALQREVNELKEKLQKAKENLYIEMLREGIANEEAWSDAEIDMAEGRVIPLFTREGMAIHSPDKYLKWCRARGLTEMVEVPTYEASMNFVESGSHVVDSLTGEVVDGWVVERAEPSFIYLKPTKL